MSLLICTPMYAQSCTQFYCHSAIRLSESLMISGLEHDWLFASDSLVPRVRNNMAATFLGTDYRKLLWIDADIRFQPEDVAKLWNLDAEVCCAAYPMKRPDAPLSAWVGGRLVKDMDNLPVPVPVDYAGTGFMMIDRSVFERMRADTPEIEHREGNPGTPGTRKCWAFFDCGVVDGVYLSEDYWFCRKWREMGGEILLDPTIRLGHVGAFVYEGNGSRLAFAQPEGTA